ncbi:methyltransferase [Chitinophaga sp. Cy-1792]|uniref:methyltransferase n=1 Tax=Chitinophaga sp. Cy-1792 TaxID=2608339 RepID=UPI00141FFB6C|nr:methyltransferase [Chitinophaga sp. Cy-1792]NIG55586.1 methyltransferase [Chitinophaga sp. Cy-1792]
MTPDAMPFNHQWFNNFLDQSDEKPVIIDAIRKILGRSPRQACLEIGAGTQPVFSLAFLEQFQQYTIVENDNIKLKLPTGVELLRQDWEQVQLSGQYDVIIASHVCYYFKDQRKAIRKMYDALSDDGMVIVVVNGQEGDYGALKQFFYQLINKTYEPTANRLSNAVADMQPITFTVPASIHYHDYTSLFNSLALFFDQYPDEYRRHQQEIIAWLSENLRHKPFRIYQKIMVICKKPVPWKYLLHHPDYELPNNGIPIWVRDGVFAPDPQLTNSTQLLLQHMPNVDGCTILDIGCGSGIISVTAMKNGASKAVATDVSVKALENTRFNCQAHQLGNSVLTIHTDIFDHVEGRFHYIFGNLPILDDIWSKDAPPLSILKRFLTASKDHILPGGKVYFSWASFAPLMPVVEMLKQLHYGYTMHAEHRSNTMWYLFEIGF